MMTSVKGEYALQALFDLATHQQVKPIKIAEIAKRQKIPQKISELILANLKQGGFVNSRRGAEGGYHLARPAGKITVGEVLRYIETGGAGSQRGHRGAETPFTEMWRRVDASVAAILDHTNFDELARVWSEKQLKYVPNWDI